MKATVKGIEKALELVTDRTASFTKYLDDSREDITERQVKALEEEIALSNEAIRSLKYLLA